MYEYIKTKLLHGKRYHKPQEQVAERKKNTCCIEYKCKYTWNVKCSKTLIKNSKQAEKKWAVDIIFTKDQMQRTN